MSRKKRKGGRGGDVEQLREDGAIDAAAVLKAFRDLGKPLSRKELLRALGVGKDRKEELWRVLSSLLAQGRIIQIKDAYGLTESMRLITGTIQMQRSGVAFVIPDDKRRKDIFVRPPHFGDAWHGDKVAVAILPTSTGRRSEGRVARIVERATKELPVRVQRRLGANLYLCQPTDPRQQTGFMVDTKTLGSEPNPGDILQVRPDERLETQLWSGEALRNFGAEGDVGVQEDLVKTSHDIPTVFPADTLEEAERLPTVPGQEDFAGRQDLRDVGFVTIDGAKARDFDDAVHVERRGDGYTLRVAIADVGHYVGPGSALDREAQARANSYYFPQSVEPMFPERLSNGLCSLNPNVPRLAMVAQIEYSADGLPGKAAFYEAVIESKARLTYSQVNRAVVLKEAEERANIAPVLPMLEQAERLARAINARRKERGSLDLDLPEPELMFNLNGETVDIRPKVRHFGHQIIEEFMIAANEAVARHLTELGLPVLYRIHPEPDPEKVKTLLALLKTSGLAGSLPETLTPKVLQEIIRSADGTDAEYLLSRMVLRTMMQAKYTPHNEGHFGLASECYCHFTSPIRRYADLVVHRSLKASLAGPASKAPKMKGLKDLAEHLSKQERNGMDAEREILKRITVLFLRDKVGGEFNGVIAGLSDFGFWVELTEVMADGLVRLSTLNDDYYTLVPERQELLGQRTGRIFRLGQSVRVELTEVNLGRLEVTLTLLDGGQTRRSGKGAASGRRGQGAQHGSSESAQGTSGRQGRRGRSARASEPAVAAESDQPVKPAKTSKSGGSRRRGSGKPRKKSSAE